MVFFWALVVAAPPANCVDLIRGLWLGMVPEVPLAAKSNPAAAGFWLFCGVCLLSAVRLKLVLISSCLLTDKL